jgi:hypothetical protein
MKLPLHFDGHGLNDEDGKRIATFQQDEKEEAAALFGIGPAIAVLPRDMLREFINLAEEGLRNRESDAKAGVYGADDAFEEGYALVEIATRLLEGARHV